MSVTLASGIMFTLRVKNALSQQQPLRRNHEVVQ